MLTAVDVAIIIVLGVALLIALAYIGRSKKRGVGCVGCPEAPNCAKRYTEAACKTDEPK